MNKSPKKIFVLPKSFLLFFSISFLFWVLINLSKKYKSVVVFPVSYVNLPQNKLLEEEPIKQIKVVIEATGFQLLKTKINTPFIKLDIGLLTKKSKNKYFLSLNQLEVNIQNQLGNQLKIEGFLQENIVFKIADLLSKKVTVKPVIDLKFKPGFNLSEKIQITPDSVTIFGSKKMLDTIFSLPTEQVKLIDVAEPIEKELTIVLPQNTSIRVDNSSVFIFGKVEKYTEGSFLIPYQITNIPKGVLITTFPKKVKVIFKVGLSNFNKITENVFQVECDFKVSQDKNLSYLIPKLTHKSGLVKSVKMIPNKIEYLIQK